ncbi:hypothetical protein [Burkholderia multivorans]|uniref:hypothetical protein n=1 Tax=Burkholderia multivorans TaxID=87883 RepID=UPI0021BFDF29|nr:hypothetical protein [Burkholderia multivorans]
MGLSQFDQFKRDVLGFGEDAKNLPRDVANSHVKLPTDVQQGDANPQIDPNGGGPKTPSGPAGATVTVGAVPCGPGVLCPTVNVAPVVTPGGPILSSGNDQQSGESAGSTPGRVQSRINITNDGIEHIGDRHFDSNVNASQFTISESDLRRLLQDPNTVSTPITKEVQTPAGPRYIREVDTGRSIGTDKFDNFQPTSVMTVMTDKFGDLVTAFPGRLK